MTFPLASLGAISMVSMVNIKPAQNLLFYYVLQKRFTSKSYVRIQLTLGLLKRNYCVSFQRRQHSPKCKSEIYIVLFN